MADQVSRAKLGTGADTSVDDKGAGIDAGAHPNSAQGLVETATSVSPSAEHTAQRAGGLAAQGNAAADKVLRGDAWVGGDHIYAFDIIQQKYWTAPLDPEENSKYVMAGVDPAFAEEGSFKAAGYTFVCAGSNFGGGGKSIEHPILGLMGAGIKCVIADSFARLQFRNAINNGLPFMQCRGITQAVETGDELEVDLTTGRIANLTKGTEIQGAPIADFVMEIANAGGLIPYIREKIADGTISDLK